MVQINDPNLLRSLIQEHKLQDIFSFDLEQCAYVVRYDENELICHAGDFSSTLMILVEGECIAYDINKVGKIHCELHYHGLNILGLVSTLWNKPIINDIKTITPCTFVCIGIDKNWNNLHDDVKFLNYATLYLADHIRKSAGHFEQLSTRLASFILEMQHDSVFSYNLTLCADILGTSHRHLLRTLRDFCNLGILRHDGKGIYTIPNADLLREQ